MDKAVVVTEMAADKTRTAKELAEEKAAEISAAFFFGSGK